MSGSRKSLKNRSLSFNPRAENEWSKDNCKFGQKMLEKMGWSKGQGLGRNNQGVPDNVKIRMKVDNKGLGFKTRDDQWVEIQHDFSQLLSQLSENSENVECEEKSSLKSTLQRKQTKAGKKFHETRENSENVECEGRPSLRSTSQRKPIKAEEEVNEARTLKKIRSTKPSLKSTSERKLTKAEKIVCKARLLKKIQSSEINHDFKGSNLNDITGYGKKETDS